MPDVKYEFVRGNSSGIDGTSLKDGQILFDKQKKTILLDASVNGTLTRINMSGDNTFNGTAAEWEALTDAQRAAYKYVYITDDYEIISKEMEGASATTNGTTGLVPQPVAGDQDKVLHGDGTWKEASDFSGDYDDLINKPTLGTAAALDVAESGDASTSEVVKGDDSRLSDARNAADVHAWAKAETKPTYTASEVGLGNVGNFKAVSTEANQGLTTTEQANARANIGAGTSSFDGDYDSLTGKPTLGTAAEKNVATSGDAGSTEVVMGNDSRLTDSRNAADVYSWAKAATKPSYTATEVGAYTTSEVDNLLSTLETNIDWKEAVDTYNDIATTYPNPVDGWTVNVKDTDYTYRYNGSAWVAISANAIPQATTSVNGLMTTTQVTKLNGIATGAEVNVQSDWNVTDSSSDAFIKNKPTIPTYTSGTGIDIVNNVVSTKQSVSGDIDEIVDQLPPGGTGISYADVSGKPTINGVTLVGNQSAADFGLATGSQYQALTNYVTENNVKNVYDIPSLKALSGRTNTGITYTVNDDGTVSVAAGTVSGSESVFPFGDESVGIDSTNITNATHVKPNTKYIASFGVNLGAPYYIQVYYKATSSSSWTKLVEGESGTEVEFTVPSSFYDIWVRLQIYGKGITVPAMTLKPMIREAGIDADGSYQPYAKTNVELTTLAVQKGTWTPKLYDLNTFIMDGTTSDYYKIDSLGVAFFSIPKPSSDVTISTMLQIQNVPFGTVHNGAIFTPTDLNTAQGGATGIQSQTRSDGAGVAWFRPNMVGTYPASAAQTITGYLIGKFES